MKSLMFIFKILSSGSLSWNSAINVSLFWSWAIAHSDDGNGDGGGMCVCVYAHMCVCECALVVCMNGGGGAASINLNHFLCCFQKHRQGRNLILHPVYIPNRDISPREESNYNTCYSAHSHIAEWPAFHKYGLITD